jgi:hypothetical protein
LKIDNRQNGKMSEQTILMASNRFIGHALI